MLLESYRFEKARAVCFGETSDFDMLELLLVTLDSLFG